MINYYKYLNMTSFVNFYAGKNKMENERAVSEFLGGEVKFRRLYDIKKNWTLFPNEVVSNKHFNQGEFGNCFFISTIKSIASKIPRVFYEIFEDCWKNGEYEYDAEKGKIKLTLLINCKKHIIEMDDYFPFIKNKDGYFETPAFSRPNDNEVFMLFLEKAWIEINGGYKNISNIKGTSVSKMDEIFASLMDTPGEIIYKGDIKSQDELFKKLQIAERDKGAIINVGSIRKGGGHQFSIKGTCIKNGTKFITIINPWGKDDYNEWFDIDKVNSFYGNENIKKINRNYKNTGLIMVPISYFCDWFDVLTICSPHYFLDKQKYSFGLLPEVKYEFTASLREGSSLKFSITNDHKQINFDRREEKHNYENISGCFEVYKDGTIYKSAEYVSSNNKRLLVFDDLPKGNYKFVFRPNKNYTSHSFNFITGHNERVNFQSYYAQGNCSEDEEKDYLKSSTSKLKCGKVEIFGAKKYNSTAYYSRRYHSSIYKSHYDLELYKEVAKVYNIEDDNYFYDNIPGKKYTKTIICDPINDKQITIKNLNNTNLYQVYSKYCSSPDFTIEKNYSNFIVKSINSSWSFISDKVFIREVNAGVKSITFKEFIEKVRKDKNFYHNNDIYFCHENITNKADAVPCYKSYFEIKRELRKVDKDTYDFIFDRVSDKKKFKEFGSKKKIFIMDMKFIIIKDMK